MKEELRNEWKRYNKVIDSWDNPFKEITTEETRRKYRTVEHFIKWLITTDE